MPRIEPSLAKSRNRRLVVAVLAGASVFALASSIGIVAGKEKPTAANIKQGDETSTRCVRCHNKLPGNTSPFGPPNLYDVFQNHKLTLAQAIYTVHHGKGQMPVFGSTITDAEITDIVAYLGHKEKSVAANAVCSADKREAKTATTIRGGQLRRAFRPSWPIAGSPGLPSPARAEPQPRMCTSAGKPRR